MAGKQKLNLDDSKTIAEIYAIGDAISLKKSTPTKIINYLKKNQKVDFKSISEIISQLEEQYEKDIEQFPSLSECYLFEKFIQDRGIIGQEYWFCPEDWFYDQILNLISLEDVIFDIGAGDFRLDLLLSQKAKKIYAIELNPETVTSALKIIGFSLPKNVVIIVGNGFEYPIPPDVTVIIALMIHRSHDFSAEMKTKRILYAVDSNIQEWTPK